MKKVLAMFMLVGLLSVQAQALIYVDAIGGDGGNTVNAAGGSATDWFNTAGASDGIWRLRTGFSNNDNFALGTPGNEIFEASGTFGGEDCMMILTTASGLTPGQLYKVEVVYWSSHDDVNKQNWNVRCGFSSTSMLYYDRLGLDGATAGTATGKVEGDRDELLGLVGYKVADALGQIQVYIDDKPGSSYVDRTWYDGLLLNEIPEPATCVLLALGGLLLRKRR